MSRALHVVRRVRYGRVAGFTLVEALVALVVLSIGMLGIAALYMETLRASRSALYRTEAVTMAADLADRIRANRNPANAYTGGGQNAIAQSDLDDWDAVVATLPNGTGEIRFVDGLGATPSTYIIRVSWTEVGQVDPVVYELRIEV
jgi:type IV pilus assembly protein PilV